MSEAKWFSIPVTNEAGQHLLDFLVLAAYSYFEDIVLPHPEVTEP